MIRPGIATIITDTGEAFRFVIRNVNVSVDTSGSEFERELLHGVRQFAGRRVLVEGELLEAERVSIPTSILDGLLAWDAECRLAKGNRR